MYLTKPTNKRHNYHRAHQHNRLKEWWEFQKLYQILSTTSAKRHTKNYTAPIPSTTKSHNLPSKKTTLLPLIKSKVKGKSKTKLDSIHAKSAKQKTKPSSPLNSCLTQKTSYPVKSNYNTTCKNVTKTTPYSYFSSYQRNQPKMYISRQNQLKRQREWIYLHHYLATTGLNPIYVISGSDDGREPDFTLVFYQDYRLYYVGVELTTLPKLRDYMGDEELISKRWYWQALHQMARQREKEKNNTNVMRSFDRFRVPVTTLYMPHDEFAQKKRKKLAISQQDVDEVMSKKAHKVDAYYTRRPLQELWLLVHTNKYQPNHILTESKQRLFHDSDFDQVHITRYPSHKIIKVKKLNSSIH